MRRVDAAIVEHADVVHAAVGFDVVVPHHVDVVVVDVDGRGAAFGILFRRAVGGNADPVVEIRDRVVGDDVTGAVYLHGKEASQLV